MSKRAVWYPLIVALLAGCGDQSPDDDENAPCDIVDVNASAGWHSIALASLAVGVSTPIVLVATLKDGGDPDGALAALHLEVTPGSGAALPGKLALVGDLGPAPHLASARRVVLTWTPASSFADGMEHSVTVNVDPSHHAAATYPPVGTFTPDAFTGGAPVEPVGVVGAERSSVGVPSGELVRCSGGVGWGCSGSGPGEYHSSSIERPGVRVAWTSKNPDFVRMVRLAPVAGKGTFASLPSAVLEEPGATPTPLIATFSDELAVYCVRVVTVDLATGKESESAEVCSGPEAPTKIPAAADLVNATCSG